MWALLIALTVSSYAGDEIAATPVAQEDRSAWTAEQWLSGVDERAATLPGMRYSVQRSTERAGVQVDERWRTVQYGANFRIDYFGDTARQITFDGRHLVDYVPANRAAVRFDVAAMPKDEAAALIGKVLQKVAVPGFRAGVPQGVAWTIREEQQDGREVIVLDGVGQQDTTLRYVIDRDRVCVLHTTITQNGQNVLDARSSDHREVKAGVWLPHEVELRAPEAGGQVRVVMHLTKVTVLTEHPGDLFQAGLDPSIRVEERP